MEFTPSLAPFVPWTNVLGVVLVPGVDGPMSAVDTNDIPGGFYRIKMTQ
jgi:hypothetical protein